MSAPSATLRTESGRPNETVQRTGASRFAQRQIERHRRLAPVADLCVRRRAHAGLFEQEATEGTEPDSILCLLSFLLWNWQPQKYCAAHADIFIRAQPCHLWFHSLGRGKAGRHG